jgi:hypothetical protein
VHALPPTVFLVFLELAVGGLLVLGWADWSRQVSRGFLVLSLILLWLSAVLALWVRQSFPLLYVDAAWRGPELLAGYAFVALLSVYLVLVWRGAERGRRLVASLTAVAGVLALALPALVHPAASAGLLLLSLLLGALSLGSAMVAMVLGHWYLVTPNLSTRPLLGMTAVFWAAAALQGLLLPLQIALGTGPTEAAAGTAALFGTYALAFWLRLFVGIVFPVILAAMTWQTCRIRSMMSATGLLYIAVACVLAGEIAAKTIFLLTGVPT